MPRIAWVPLIAAALLLGLGGCGDDDGPDTSTTRSTAAAPALATRPAANGEIVVRGDASPATNGPYTFSGRYLVRFEQFAPEDPQLDFSGQTPFTASLTPRSNDPRGAIKLISGARATGRRELEIDGRYYVDVSFGDFPFVVRFTPRG